MGFLVLWGQMGRVVVRRRGWEEELVDKIRNNADTLERFRSLDHSRMIYSDIGCDMLSERI